MNNALDRRGDSTQSARGVGSFAGALASRCLAIIGAAGLHFWLAARLGPTEYGHYAVAFAVATLAASVGVRGYDVLCVRWIARHLAQSDPESAAGHLHFARRQAWIGGTLGGSFILIAAAVVAGAWSADGIAKTLPLVAGLALLTSLIRVEEAAARGLGRPNLGSLSFWCGPILTLAAVTLLDAVFGAHCNAAVAIGVQISVMLGLLFVVRANTARSLPLTTGGSVRRSEWSSESTPITLVMLASVAQVQAPLLIVATLLGAEAAGCFGIATRIASMLLIGSQAANLVVGQRIAANAGRQDTEGMQRDARQAVAISFGVAVLGAILVLASGDAILRLFGEGYADARIALVILSFGAIVNAGCGVVGELLNMTGHAWLTFRGVAFGAMVSLVATATLSLPFGLSGAAAGSALGLATWNVFLAIAVSRRLEVHSHVGCLLWRREAGVVPPSPEAAFAKTAA